MAIAAQTEGRLGVDVERFEVGDARLVKKVLSAREVARYSADGPAAARATTTLFSLKEAAYKALHPRRQPNVDFQDMEVTLHTPQAGVWFSATVEVQQETIRGAIIMDDHWVVATVRAD